MLLHLPVIEVLHTFKSTMGGVDVATPEMSINRVSMILGVASCIIAGVSCGIDPWSKYCQPSRAIRYVSISLILKMSIDRASTEHQQSVNNYHYCIWYNPRAMLPHLPIIDVLPAIMGNTGRVNVTTPEMSINSASTILGVASCIIEVVCCGIYPLSKYCLPLCAICQVSISVDLKMSINRVSTGCQPSINRVSAECQQRVNTASTECQHSVNRASTERQQSVNRASTIFGLVHKVFGKWFACCYP